MAEDDVVVAKKKRTLLEKYDIPLNHLSYEYVKKCNNGKELEKIVKILRSGEEGLYPDLIICAESRLTEIMPSSRVLRVAEPALTKSMLGPEHWDQVTNDLVNWSSEMKSKEQFLNEGGDSLVTADIPDIRSEKTTKGQNNEIREQKKIKRVVPRDYSEWDKYDADKEILRMDLEEEIKKEDLEKKQRLSEKNNSLKPISRPKLVGSGDYSITEKEFLATQEKDKGNEYFKAKEFNLAVEHYSASIEIEPSPVAYNNRAMAYLKLEKYFEALEDCNEVLKTEPNNVKALHRRGLACKHTGSYQKALDDFLKILRLEPGNKAACTYAQELQARLGSNKKSVRMHITEDEGNGPKIVELSDEPYVDEPCIRDPSAKINTSWPDPPDRRVKCNKFGFPKIMCSCSGVPDWVRRPPPKCLTCQKIKAKIKADRQKTKETNSNETNEICSSANNANSDDDCFCEHKSDNDVKTETDNFSSNETSQQLSSVDYDVVNKKKEASSKLEIKSGDPSKDEANVQAIQGLTLEDGSSIKISTPFEFVNAFQAAKGEDPAVLAQVLLRIDPADLHTLIGNKLDDTMLQSILLCLEKHFINDGSFVLKFLENLASLPRFGIVNMFLDSKTKQVVGRLFENLRNQGFSASAHVQQMFKL